VATYLNELSAADLARVEIPLAEVLPAPQGGVDTGETPPDPPHGIGHCRQFAWAPEIKAVAVIPDFEVPTHAARQALPSSYSRADIVFNMQRVALLPTVLGQSPPDPEMIYLAMQDKVHQPYRKELIPGLPQILQSMSPASTPGLLGISLSGAGPTILALATHNFETIAQGIVQELTQRFKERYADREIACRWMLLEPAHEGAVVERR
jgi:homoserine kinase